LEHSDYVLQKGFFFEEKGFPSFFYFPLFLLFSELIIEQNEKLKKFDYSMFVEGF
jgi:hypothetical protein